MSEPRRATVVVIGAGQAGLSAGYHLQRHDFASAMQDPDAERSFVILDAEERPGGAWQHRWASLTMATVNRIFDLPGFRQDAVDSSTPSRDAVPAYFSAYEARTGLPILRPVRVSAVRRADTDPDGDLLVDSDAGVWRASAVINATGTWNNPVLPEVPGAERFLGRQLHTRDYVALDEFAGRSVAVVGGGISAVQQLEEISRVARVAWYTRREPVFLDGDFSPEVEGRETIAKVAADVEAGNPSRSVVSYTGLPWNSYARGPGSRSARAPPDVHGDRTARCARGRRILHLGRHDPVGHWFPAVARAPGSARPAQRAGRDRDARDAGRRGAPTAPHRLRSVAVDGRREPCRARGGDRDRGTFGSAGSHSSDVS